MIKKTFFFLLITLFLILLAEAGLRLFSPVYLVGYDEAYVYDDKIGAVFKPNIHYLNTTDYLQETKTNKIGTLNFQESFAPYKYFVFAVGDSYTQGSGLPFDASYPFQLDLLLNFKEGEYRSEYAVINLGREATGGIQALLYLDKFRNITPKVDYILYLACQNDAMDDRKYNKGIKHKNIVDNSPYWGVWTPVLKFLKNRTEIGKRLYLLAYKILVLPRKKPVPNGKAVDLADKAPPNLKTTDLICREQLDIFLKFKKISQEMGAKLIIGWVSNKDAKDQYQWLKNWAQKNDIEFADWQEKVVSVKKTIPNLPIGNPHSGGHYRTWVNNLIARSFAEHIQKTGASER